MTYLNRLGFKIALINLIVMMLALIIFKSPELFYYCAINVYVGIRLYE